jgi:hypothetical protein
MQKQTVLIGTDFHSLPHHTFCYTQVESGLAPGTNEASTCPEAAHFQGVTFYIYFFNKNPSKYNTFFIWGGRKQSQCWVEQFCITSKKNTVLVIVTSGLEH